MSVEVNRVGKGIESLKGLFSGRDVTDEDFKFIREGMGRETYTPEEWGKRKEQLGKMKLP